MWSGLDDGMRCADDKEKIKEISLLFIFCLADAATAHMYIGCN